MLGAVIIAPAALVRQAGPAPGEGMILVWVDERIWTRFCDTAAALRSLH